MHDRFGLSRERDRGIDDIPNRIEHEAEPRFDFSRSRILPRSELIFDSIRRKLPRTGANEPNRLERLVREYRQLQDAKPIVPAALINNSQGNETGAGANLQGIGSSVRKEWKSIQKSSAESVQTVEDGARILACEVSKVDLAVSLKLRGR